MSESLALYRYIAMKCGFYPKDPEEAALCDELVERYQSEVIGKIKDPGLVQDPEVRKEKLNLALNDKDGALFLYLTEVEKLVSGNGFICGNDLCLADFVVAGIYSDMICNPTVYERECWEAFGKKFPTFCAYG